ncbi:hypothetical protein ABZP36_007495 [Zizania latifolia]
MEGGQLETACLPALYALGPYAQPSPSLLAPLPGQHKLPQLPLLQEQAAGNHGVMFSSDHGCLYPLLPGIPFCHSAAAAAAAAAACEKTTAGFAPFGAGEAGTSSAAAKADNEIAATAATGGTTCHGPNSWWKGSAAAAEKGKMKGNPCAN